MTGAARIVSLVPSITELLVDLGLRDQVVGRTGFCIHPADAVRGIPKVGGTKDVNLERIRALSPTHVIVNIDENDEPVVRALEAFVPSVIVTHPNAPQDNFALYRRMGELFDCEARAQRLCADLQAALDGLSVRSWPAANVLYAIWKDPWMTVARDTYISSMLALVNWTTLPDVLGGERGAARYPEFRFTDALVSRIDCVLLSSEPYRFTAAHADALERQIGKSVLLIDGEMASWYGSRAIGGVRYLAKFATESGIAGA